MLDFSNLIQSKNGNCDEEKKESMKDYIDFTLDTTKKGQQKIEHKTLSNKEENQNKCSNKPKSPSNIKTIETEPEFNYISQDSSQKISPQKENPNQKIIKQAKIHEKIEKNNSFDLQDSYKLIPHFFKIEEYLEPFNIKKNESGSIKLKQTIQNIDICINKYKEIADNEKSLSDIAKILEKEMYLLDKKEKIEKIVDSINQNINFDNIENYMNPIFEENKKENINNNKLNCLNNEMLSSITSNQQATKENDNTFLNKKRYLKKDITEKPEKKITKTKEKSNNDNNNIKKIGRLSNELRNKGVKGIKDGAHPDNGVVKIMRHSLNNICSILVIILQLIDNNFYIFLPGINDKDLKNTTTKQDYLEKTIDEILCVYVSIETKKNKIVENRNKINGLLAGHISGKEKEQNLVKKILKMKLKDVCLCFINNIKDFIDGYKFNTFEDDEDFKKYDDSKIDKILKQAEDLIKYQIKKRPKSLQ